ncbi:hypothetical protein [Candidatus Harpocratesius sp.]
MNFPAFSSTAPSCSQHSIFSGISRSEIISFFQNLSPRNKDSTTKSAKKSFFYVNSCKVCVNETNSQCFPGFFIPCTEIIFEGEENAVQSLMAQFRKKFLRGGG